MDSSIADKILAHMQDAPRGTLFFVDDFYAMGLPDNIRQSLTRLCRRKLIARAATGIFYIPKKDKWDGRPLSPSLEDIATAVAEKSNVRVAPAGLVALNALGLSTQVPGTVAYLTDGAPRNIKTADGTLISFRHTSDMSWFSYQSEMMQLIVIAMKELGEGKATPGEIAIVKALLTKVSPSDFAHDIILAPQWIRKLLTA